MPFKYKSIADPIHGSIGLSEIELDIIASKPFQRLRNVKQLGLAHLVYPGANFSRFSHCVGVCHTTWRILESLSHQIQDGITNDEMQLYRLAGLLHDIGHYPFSHAMEDAISNHYKETAVFKRKGESENGAEVKYYNHERVGKVVLDKSPEIQDIFSKHGISPDQVHGIFTRKNTSLKYTNLISSDLDADRIDYLLRTAHHTGLPYGGVDIDYLIGQMTIEKIDGGLERLCLPSKALKAADHFLLSRYFDYQQVAYHKTVAALELVLKDVIGALLKEDIIKCHPQWVEDAIENHAWATFDDGSLVQEVRNLLATSSNEVVVNKCKALLERKAPKLIFEFEALKDKDDSHFTTITHYFKTNKAKWAREYGIAEDYWYTWDMAMSITKVGSHVKASMAYEDHNSDDKYEQAIRILGKNVESVPITECPRSLMSTLADKRLCTQRLYLLLPSDQEGRLDDIREKIKKEMETAGIHAA